MQRDVKESEWLNFTSSGRYSLSWSLDQCQKPNHLAHVQKGTFPITVFHLTQEI